MQLQSTRIRLINAFLGIAAALMLSSCIYDSSLCPSGDDLDGKGLVAEFSMVTRNAASGTRALIEPAGNQETGTAAENYLDLDRLVFLLFDNNQTLLRVFRPEVEAEDTGTYIKYKVRAFLNDPYFLRATSDELTFTIVVLGNYSLLSPQRFAFHVGQKLSEIFDPAKVGTFAMPISNNSGNSWIPSIFNVDYTDASGAAVTGMTPAYIPMAGMQTFTVSVAALRASTLDNPLQLSDSNGTGSGGSETGGKEINMLRALAKIEIVDRINAVGTGEATVQPDKRSSIVKAELIGHTTVGSILPGFDDWNRDNSLETQYVRTVSLPSGWAYVGANPAGDGNLSINNPAAAVNFFADASATAARDDGCRVFSCYLTEYNPASIGTGYPMWIRLTCQSPAQEGAEAVSTYYRLNVAPYENSLPGANMPVLRNNIYRYEIAGIKTDLELELIVNNWTSENTEWKFTDVPGMNEGGYMTWASDILSEDRATATLVYNTPLTGTFRFEEPKGGTWTAILVPGPNTESDAFGFVTEDGTSAATSISGTIDGNRASVTIRANYPKATGTAENRSARLLFTVLTPDGRTITANVLGSTYGSNKYFTIIQEPAL